MNRGRDQGSVICYICPSAIRKPRIAIVSDHVLELLRCFGAGNMYSIRPENGEEEADNDDAGDWSATGILVGRVMKGEDGK